MTRAVFFNCDGQNVGFRITGHTANNGSHQAQLVCSAVSSAAYMAANTITEVIGVAAEIKVDDGFMQLNLSAQQQDSAALAVIDGLKLHLDGLAEQYRKNIEVITEVQTNA